MDNQKNIPPETGQEMETEERYELLKNIEEWLEGPVQFLGLVWLVLLVVEFTRGLGPILNTLVYIIWAIFILDFVIRLVVAPNRARFVKNNWLTVISLALPALRILSVFRFIRFFRLARAARGTSLVKVIGSLNRGMRTLRAYLGRRKFGYAIALTLIVTVAGAAGMFVLENQNTTEGGFNSFGDALWWTAMIMTTLGSDYWPQSPEGRLLGFLLSVYAFSVFGYVTATLATYLVGQEVSSRNTGTGNEDSFRALQQQIIEMQTEIRRLSSNLNPPH